MTMNTQGRPTASGVANSNAQSTFTGNKGLQIEEALSFEIGRLDITGVDLPEAPKVKPRLGKHARKGEMGIPALSEPETCGISCGSARRTTASIPACSRSAPAR